MRAGGAAGWTRGFYERHDEGARLAGEARRRFLAATVERGEAGMDLAEAALAVAAEDDALVTGSVVPLPVEAYLQRLEKMVDELASKRLAHLDAAAAAPRDVLDVVDAYLFGEKRFRVPVSGRSKLERGLVIVNPGCYEDAAHAYLHQVGGEKNHQVLQNHSLKKPLTKTNSKTTRSSSAGWAAPRR